MVKRNTMDIDISVSLLQQKYGDKKMTTTIYFYDDDNWSKPLDSMEVKVFLRCPFYHADNQAYIRKQAAKKLKMLMNNHPGKVIKICDC